MRLTIAALSVLTAAPAAAQSGQITMDPITAAKTVERDVSRKARDPFAVSLMPKALLGSKFTISIPLKNGNRPAEDGDTGAWYTYTNGKIRLALSSYTDRFPALDYKYKEYTKLVEYHKPISSGKGLTATGRNVYFTAEDVKIYGISDVNQIKLSHIEWSSELDNTKAKDYAENARFLISGTYSKDDSGSVGDCATDHSDTVSGEIFVSACVVFVNIDTISLVKSGETLQIWNAADLKRK